MKKKQPVPLTDVRADFFDALEKVTTEAILMIGCVESILAHDVNITDGVREILTERKEALRISIFGAE